MVSSPPCRHDRRPSSKGSVQLEPVAELGCAPSLVWSVRSAPLKSPIRSRSVCAASSRDAWSPASAERWSSTADRRPSSEADTSRITDRSGSVVAVAASWFTSVASRSIDDSTSVHRAGDIVAGVPIASSAATRSCSANPWELTAWARECQARASRRREAIRATISATTIAAIATSTQIHGEIVSASSAAGSTVGCSVGSSVGSSCRLGLLGRLFGRLGLLRRLLGRLGLLGRLRSIGNRRERRHGGRDRRERWRRDGDRGDRVRDARPDLVPARLGTRRQQQGSGYAEHDRGRACGEDGSTHRHQYGGNRDPRGRR